MVSLTPAEEKALGRKREQPVKNPGELFAVFVRGRLVNPLNERHDTPYFAGKHARYKRQWKERIVLALLEAGWRVSPYGAKAVAAVPKLIGFLACVPKAFDADGLRAAMKPFPDALKDCGVIADDRDSSGHQFVYAQEVKRGATIHGVTIRVRVR